MIFGLSCFMAGSVTQWLLPVFSNEFNIECEETTTPKDNLPSDSDNSPQQEPPIEKNSQDEKIKAYARSITVKVFSGDNSGSGVLIKRENNVYQVVTNDHVLIFGRQNQSYKVETPDGQVYPAEVVKLNLGKYDLGVLQFVSEQYYKTASLSSINIPEIGEKVYAVGFPHEADSSVDDGFVFTTGKVDMISDLSFRGGYRIGYSNEVEKGMSGGALLNEEMQVIGLNGRHKYPLWGNPYIFEDGTVASVEKKEEMSKSSCAIPIQTFLNFAPEYISEKNTNISEFH